MIVKPGVYVVGFDKPWYASYSKLTEELKKRGLALLPDPDGYVFHERGAAPPPVDPSADPSYSDKWDHWIEVEAPDGYDDEPVWAWLVKRDVSLEQRQAQAAGEAAKRSSDATSARARSTVVQRDPVKSKKAVSSVLTAVVSSVFAWMFLRS